MTQTDLTLLFLKQKNAEEVRFQFTKSSKIHLFSFCFGEDFNFLVVTNNLITLYDIKISKQKAKTVKQIPIQLQGESLSACFFEPMANTLVVVDCRGQVTVYYLTLHGVKVKSNASKVSK